MQQQDADTSVDGTPPPSQIPPAATSSSVDEGPSGLSILGWLIFLSGIAVAVISFCMPTTVKSYDVPDYLSASEISNIGMLQQQMMVLHVGIGMTVIGAVFIGTGAVLGMARRG